MIGTPTFWEVVNLNAPVLGWAFLCSCIAFCTRLVWKMRGGLDLFFANQEKDRDLSQRIFLSVEEAKKEDKEEAIQGAKDILAEAVSDHADLRETIKVREENT